MTDGFLSQEEIDSLLNGGGDSKEEQDEVFSDLEKDLLGEIGNISMGSASTALSQIINQPVNITTPIVSLTSFSELKKDFAIPYIALDIKYIEGIVGENLLVMKINDAGVIANLMMGGDGKIETTELTELEVSAVQEAMNQMIGSSATSMSTMLGRTVNISPPTSSVWDGETEQLADNIDESDIIVKTSFHLTIGDLIDSNIMQLLPLSTAKKICKIMMGEDTEEEVKEVPAPAQPVYQAPAETVAHKEPIRAEEPVYYQEPTAKAPVEVSKASFQPLREAAVNSLPSNIDLILDVGLDISVVLGRTKKSIKDILALGTGSLIELDKLAEEPVEILVNGKKIAYGEVIVVDENFGVRITSIISGEERVKTLGK
ncbi:MAG: flagellar motor switch phosphatase FliY [Clostridiaceae bacterium]